MYMTIEISYYQYHGYSFHSKDFFRIVCAINNDPLAYQCKKGRQRRCYLARG
uniref:Uncharacterized protein n=1 Tax=Populus trichocarpa TaxID=3694 RepID=A0A3N7FZT8_POPTR